MAKQVKDIDHTADHAHNQLEAFLDQYRRRAMGQETEWQLQSTSDEETGVSLLTLAVKQKVAAPAKQS